MTQHILMILPSTEDEKPRMVGPFLTEATAHAWADSKEIDPVRRMIRPLESPTSIYGYGRHALIPSPVPRNVAAGALAAWEEKKAAARKRSGGGISGVLEGIYGPPPPFPDVPTRMLAEDEGVLYQRGADGSWEPVGPPGRVEAPPLVRESPIANPTLRIESEREDPPPDDPPLTGGIRHWVTGEALEAAPANVLRDSEAVVYWYGTLAQFNSETTDGRMLELNEPGAGDWLAHFQRVPVGVWIMVKNVGALPIGLCERVRVENGWLLGEGRISLPHFEKAAPELYRQATSGAFEAREYIPAAIDVTGGQRQGGHVFGPWELGRVVFGSVPAWPGCRAWLGEVELKQVPR